MRTIAKLMTRTIFYPNAPRMHAIQQILNVDAPKVHIHLMADVCMPFVTLIYDLNCNKIELEGVPLSL